MINKAKIKADIVNLIKSNQEVDQDKSIKYFADGLSEIIADAIKSADVTVDAGISVSTTGTAAAQTGATTSIGKGSLS